MPTSAPTPCSAPGCPALTHGGRCDAHSKQKQQHYNQARGTAAQRGYDASWYAWLVSYRAARDRVGHPDYYDALEARNRCAHCWLAGKLNIRRLEFDHITPLSQGGKRLDPANVQPLCHACHNRKTASEGGRVK